MQGRIWYLGPALLMGAGLTLGCSHDGATRSYPSDPLLLCKQPVEAHPSANSRTLAAAQEPEPPPLLMASLADRDHGPALAGRRPVAGTPVLRHSDEAGLPWKPANRQRETSP